MSGLTGEFDDSARPANGGGGLFGSPRGVAAVVAGGYLLAGGLWILLSDRVLWTMVPHDDVATDFLTKLQTFKGWFFVAVTGLLLFALVHWGGRRLRAGQHAVERSESLFRGVVESNAAAICVWRGADGRVLRANDALLDLVGYTRADLRGGLVDWQRMTPDEFALRDAAAIEQARNRRRGSDPYERPFLRKDGRRVPVLLTVAPMVGGSNEGDDVLVAALVDISERKRAEEQAAALTRALESAGKLKDEFLAMLSHELRTPITAIRLWADLLRTDAGRDAELRKEALANIEQGVEAQTQLINDLLDVSRIASGQMRVEREPTDLRPLVRTAAEALAPSARDHGLRLHLRLGDGMDGVGVGAPTAADPDSGALTVLGDAGRLRQVAWNLLANAIKFTPRGGQIDLELRRAPGRAVLSVSDTGEGLRSEFVPHLFEPFRQSDSSTTRRHGGLGIGLSIVRRLVEMHDGTIRAESGGLGKGSTFVVELPLESTPDAPALEPPPATQRPSRFAAADTPDRVTSTASAEQELHRLHSPPPLAGVRILVVDDHPETRRAVSRLLKSLGADVDTAASGAAALASAKAAWPRVMISDIGMPGFDGYDLIRALRAEKPAATANGLPKMHAVALTAFAMPEDSDKALAAGFDEYLSKPVNFGELLESVRRGTSVTVDA